MSTPQSIIKICSGVRLTNRYDHTIYFDNITAQNTYFDNKVVKSFVAYTYLRKAWKIKINDTIDNAIKWSYLFFTNGGKRYYYFITDVEYINDGTVELSLEIDVMQTYAFDYNLLDCYVDREHIQSDGIGANVIDENLDTGEFRVLKQSTVELTDLNVVIQTTCNLRLIERLSNDASQTVIDTAYEPMFATKLGGAYGGCCYYTVEASQWNNLASLLKKIDGHGKIDVILNMYMYPKALIQYTANAEYITNLVENTDTIEHGFTTNMTDIDGYKPRNWKVLQSPYNLITIDNNYGGQAILKPEHFGDETKPYFKIVGSPLPDGSVKCYPINYKNVQHNYEEGVTLGNFPMCAWNSDPYKLWVAQNQSSNTVGMVAGVGTIVAGAVTTVAGAFTGGLTVGAGLGMLAGGGMQIANQLAQKKDREVQPVQSRGHHSSSVNVANGWQTFIISQKQITKEYAKTIDDYFTMYGYKTSRVKKPNINSRPAFNYVRTIGSNVIGDVPQRDLSKINEIFDNGITFWKNGDKIGDYSLNNY